MSCACVVSPVFIKKRSSKRGRRSLLFSRFHPIILLSTYASFSCLAAHCQIPLERLLFTLFFFLSAFSLRNVYENIFVCAWVFVATYADVKGKSFVRIQNDNCVWWRQLVLRVFLFYIEALQRTKNRTLVFFYWWPFFSLILSFFLNFTFHY
jgi:hypothetical protein